MTGTASPSVASPKGAASAYDYKIVSALKEPDLQIFELYRFIALSELNSLLQIDQKPRRSGLRLAKLLPHLLRFDYRN